MSSTQQSRASFLPLKTLRHLTKYLVIGGIVFAIDTGTFQALLFARVIIPIAATIGYIAGVSMHFSLNRFFNFRNFDRQWHSQALTYGTVVFLQWLLTLLIIEVGVHATMMTPLMAKTIAVVVNIPIGFLAHRYLTFGPGIFARLKQLRGGARS